MASYNGAPVSQYLTTLHLEKVAADTMVGGATLTKLLGTSAWYAPGASVAYLVDSILKRSKANDSLFCILEGEYGLNDICIGVPCIIGANGVETILEIQLDALNKKTCKERKCYAVRVMKALKML